MYRNNLSKQFLDILEYAVLKYKCFASCMDYGHCSITEFLVGIIEFASIFLVPSWQMEKMEIF